MSYCRTSDPESDVYMIGTKDSLCCFGAAWTLEVEKPVHPREQRDNWHIAENGKIERTGETHDGPLSVNLNSRSEMINHLEAHRAAGHQVPDHTFIRLREEIAEVGDNY